MGGIDGPMWAYFKASMNLGFNEVRKHSDKLIGLVEMLLQTNTKLPCFHGSGPDILEGLRSRFYLGKTDKQCEEHMDELINESIGNWRTLQYDKFQYNSNGILF
jgi:phosphatidylinositol 4-kinase